MQQWTTITHHAFRYCRVRFDAFQLDNLCRNSCIHSIVQPDRNLPVIKLKLMVWLVTVKVKTILTFRASCLHYSLSDDGLTSETSALESLYYGKLPYQPGPSCSKGRITLTSG